MKSATVRVLGCLLAAGVGTWLCPSASTAGEPAIPGYTDYDAYRLQLESIAASPYADLKSLGRTRGGREVYLLEIGAGRPHQQPALLILGSVHPPHRLGKELAVRLGRRLVEEAKSDSSVRKMLERFTFYVIPEPAPDAGRAFFERPYFERSGNRRPVDDDRDGEVDEDGPEDLDGDGWITMIRVADPTGPYMPHPHDPRLLIEADPKRNERGCYRLYVEGRDNDEDEEQGEDPAGGVAFNRNFTFRYPYFEAGAGPHQVSEVETRAVADFAYSHANIAAVLSFTPEDNLMRPWKPDSSSESKRIKTAVLSADAPYLDYVAEQYREIHGGQDPPESPRGEGSFSEWAYFHYGRWSFACRGWWIPNVKAEGQQPERPAAERQGDETAAEDPQDDEGAAKSPAGDEDGAKGPEGDEGAGDERKTSGDKRAADDRNALRWFAREGIDGFVDWQPIEHPDFPDQEVEVGGFRPFWRLNPPADRLEPLTEKHWQFLRRLVELLPRLAIDQLKAEPLGGGGWRVRAVVVNHGYLPSCAEMGRLAGQLQPLQIELKLPEGATLATGYPRRQLSRIEGGGGKAEATWLVLVPEEGPTWVRLRVWSPSVGTKSKRIKLSGPGPSEQKKKASQP